ncbi:MAG: ABC transporter substrate-binding protein [Proteobacteria bacterium]|nr:ABC transporter substrate-binding protein [Pseudomonadota bacterium]
MMRALLVAALMMVAQSAAAIEPVRVGLIATLSGPSAPLGRHLRDGFMLGLKQSGGLLGGRPLKLAVHDDARDVAALTSQAPTLMKTEKPQVVIGPLFNPLLGPVLKAATEAKAIVISPRAAPAALAGKRCQSNFFSLAPQDDEAIEALAKFAEERNLTRAIIVSTVGEEADIAATAFTRAFKGEVADRIQIAPDATDFTDMSNRIDVLRPQAVFLHVGGAIAGPLLKFLSESGATSGMVLLGSAGFDEADLSSPDGTLMGVYSASDWAYDLKNPANEAFLQAFQSEYGYAPGAVAMRGYDAARLLDAAYGALTKDPVGMAELAEAIRQASIDSPRGKFNFGNNNFPIEDIYLTRIEPDASGQPRNAVQKQIFAQYGDHYASECPLK